MATLNRREFEEALNIYMVELNHICLNITDTELRELQKHKFGEQLEENLSDLNNSMDSPARALYGAFGFLDEYVSADREKVISSTFSAYCLAQNHKRPWWRFW